MIEKEAAAVSDEIESNGNADATKESEFSNILGRGENATSKRSCDTNVSNWY